MLQRLFRRTADPDYSRAALTYREQTERLKDADTAVRADLAAREETRPEILYYLAGDPDPSVRAAVAANTATPVQADELLTQDVDEEVRRDLALKIARLIPGMPDDEVEKVRELTLQVLDTLARDQFPRVRAMLAEELKDADNVPKSVVRRLAGDMEAIVAVPVLQYSPLLGDADFIEIIAAGCAQEALCAIAGRSDLSDDVSDAVVATFDVPAVAALLTNKSAQIREETLDRIVDHARNVEAWHEPLVMRPDLSIRAVRRIAGFVATSLLQQLCERSDLDEALAADLKIGLNRRIEASTGAVQDDERQRAQMLDRKAMLDEDALNDAIDTSQGDFVIEAMTIRTDLPRATVVKILGSGNPAAVTALAWKAGVAMRTAIRLQSKIARIPPQSILNARDGIDYPLSEKELAWQLELFS